MAVQLSSCYGYAGRDLRRSDSVVAQGLDDLAEKLRVFAGYAARLACPVAEA